jgi:omega-amidase
VSKITISLAQMNIIPGDTEHNRATFREMVAEAAQNKSELVVFPELFSTGYVLEEAQDYASESDEGMFAEMSDMAAEHKIAITGSILEKHKGAVANCLAYFDAEGKLQGRYRKMHLFRLFDEEKYLLQGDSPTVLDLAWGKAGTAICYDLRFPELFRHYATQHNTTMLIIPAEWPLIRVEHWRALLIARAIENQGYVVACNSAEKSGETIFAGHSMIIDPWGKVILEAGEKEELVTAEIELDEIANARGKIPVFDDLRRDTFRY